MNVIMHIPHASTGIPQEYLEDFKVSSDRIVEEIRLMTDWYVDELFEECIGSKVVFPISRLVCDVERFEDDSLEPMAEKGMGVCYTRDHNCRKFKKVSEEHRREMLEHYYRTHHSRLEKQVSYDLKLCKHALILDCHSFSSVPYMCDMDKTPERPDICIGIDAYHTPEELFRFTYDYFSCFRRYRIETNTPFSGTIVPAGYYRKNPKVHSIMIEINRSLYMDETTGEKNCCFDEITSLMYGYVERLRSCKNGCYERIGLKS